ncbi:MAG: serine hydrolase domain-containing protein [Pseudomonadota bacterium]
MYKLNSIIMNHDKIHQYKTISLGIFDSSSEIYYQLGKSKSSPESLYEIGSLTKTFTALAISDLSISGVINLSDKLHKILSPFSSTSPLGNQKVINFLQHTSGLPKNPDIQHCPNPRRQVTFNSLKQLIQYTKLNPSSDYSYSNFGYGILGTILKEKLSSSLDEIYLDFLFKHIDLKQTVLRTKKIESVLTGYDNQNPVSSIYWDKNAFLGSGGGLVSCTSDLTKYARNVIFGDNKFTPALKQCLENKLIITSNYHTGLGWKYHPILNIYWHDGITPGFRSFWGFNYDKNISVCLLANSSVPEIKDDFYPGEFDNLGFEIIKEIDIKKTQR